MQIREFSKPVTSKALNESLAKQFGFKLNLEQFTDMQLEDARNKLRTKMSQLEVNESYDGLTESPEYQKTRMFLDTINQEIMEREEGKCPSCHHTPCDCSHEEEEEESVKTTAKKVEENYVNSTFRNRALANRVPTTWINEALRRVEDGDTDRAELKAELKLRYELTEAKAAWILLEGEEEKAKVIMATKDMVDRITGWLEDTAAMKAEQLLELLDSIRETMGSDVAQQYQEQVKPALEAIYTALETSRTGLSAAMATVSGGEQPATMGAPAGGMGDAMAGMTADMASAGAEGGEEATPPAPEAERIKRESVDYSRRLGMILAQSKKK